VDLDRLFVEICNLLHPAGFPSTNEIIRWNVGSTVVASDPGIRLCSSHKVLGDVACLDLVDPNIRAVVLVDGLSIGGVGSDAKEFQRTKVAKMGYSTNAQRWVVTCLFNSVPPSFIHRLIVPTEVLAMTNGAIDRWQHGKIETGVINGTRGRSFLRSY
jgi:hypothetical protein